MPPLQRVTAPLLDVLVVLLDAHRHGQEELHGWAIMKSARRSGPTTYGVLDRLEEARWVTGRWEAEHPDGNKPRRRFYRLTPHGVTGAADLLRARGRRLPAHGPAAATRPGLAAEGGAR
ncbi:PadR family transcriptional regulator [Dactylosporangium sp. McL0621]|uniref:PadR family transcriptional regulator n=1 Tax=Dactylosporangium sp. McL0621 TaxID=3415678 RepID=UPI003CF43240